MIKVAAVSFRPEIRNMLQRYVGGVLKDIGTVKAMTTEEAIESNSDLYVVYTMGPVYKQLCKYVDPERVVQAKLFPMPASIKKVMMLPEGSRIGIVAGHRWDAADFLGQLIATGVRNYLFSTDLNNWCLKFWFLSNPIHFRPENKKTKSI